MIERKSEANLDYSSYRSLDPKKHMDDVTIDDKLYDNLVEINRNISNICHFEMSENNIKSADTPNQNSFRASYTHIRNE